MKTWLVISCFSFAVCANAQYGPGGKYLTPLPDNSAAIARQNAAISAQLNAAQQQAQAQYAIALALQQQALDAARQKLWDDALSKINDEAQQAVDKLSAEYSPNLKDLESQKATLEQKAANLNEQKAISETK